MSSADRAGPPGWVLVALLVPGAGFIATFLAAALAMTLAQSFGLFALTRASRLTVEYWAVLLDRQFLDAFAFSLWVALVSAVGTLVLAFPLALFLRRRRAWLIGAFVKIPLFVPALVAAFLILNVMAYHGLLNEMLTGLGLVETPLRMLNDRWGIGIVAIQIWKNLPFQLLIIAATMEGIRVDLEEAARNLGASRLEVIRLIVLPLSMPGVVVAVSLQFVMVFGDFAIFKVAGPVYPPSLSLLMTTKAMTFQEWNAAACIGVVIVLASLLAVAAYAHAARLLDGGAPR